MDLLDCWIFENIDVEFLCVLVGFDYNYYGVSFMDFSVQKVFFLCLFVLILVYIFLIKVINVLKLINLCVYVIGFNFFCLINYNGYDLEIGDWYFFICMYIFGFNLVF